MDGSRQKNFSFSNQFSFKFTLKAGLKTSKNLRVHSLEIFNKRSSSTKPSHLAIYKLSRNSNIVKFCMSSHIL